MENWIFVAALFALVLPVSADFQEGGVSPTCTFAHAITGTEDVPENDDLVIVRAGLEMGLYDLSDNTCVVWSTPDGAGLGDSDGNRVWWSTVSNVFEYNIGTETLTEFGGSWTCSGLQDVVRNPQNSNQLIVGYNQGQSCLNDGLYATLDDHTVSAYEVNWNAEYFDRGTTWCDVPYLKDHNGGGFIGCMTLDGSGEYSSSNEEECRNQANAGWRLSDVAGDVLFAAQNNHVCKLETGVVDTFWDPPNFSTTSGEHIKGINGVSATVVYLYGEGGRAYKFNYGGSEISDHSIATDCDVFGLYEDYQANLVYFASCDDGNFAGGVGLGSGGGALGEPAEFDAGLLVFIVSLGFITAESQFFFAIILVGLVTVATGAGSKVVSAGHWKNYAIIGVGALVGVFMVLMDFLALWVWLVCFMLAIFAVKGTQEARNTYHELKKRIDEARTPDDLFDGLGASPDPFQRKQEEEREEERKKQALLDDEFRKGLEEKRREEEEKEEASE